MLKIYSKIKFGLNYLTSILKLQKYQENTYLRVLKGKKFEKLLKYSLNLKVYFFIRLIFFSTKSLNIS